LLSETVSRPQKLKNRFSARYGDSDA